MGSVSAAAEWTAEDDHLLTTAIEAGASLESLAKGAVCFSHKYTLKELEDRWYSLLYDPEMSAQASARTAEYETEILTSNPAKACKLLNPEAKGFPEYKRKIDSVKVQYHAKIKRVRHEPCLSADLGYGVVPCSCVRKDGGGGACGCQLNPLSGGAISIYGCGGGSDADGQHVPSNGNEPLNTENDPSDGRIMIDGGMPDFGLGNATVSEGGFMHSRLMGFCMKEDLDLFSSGHDLHSTLDINQDNIGDSQTKDFLKVCSGDVQCILNTEDSDIPFSDHIPIPDQSSLLTISTLKQDSQHDMCLVSTKPMNMEHVVPSPIPPPPLKLEPAIKQQKERAVGNLSPVMHCDFGNTSENIHTKALHSVDEGEGTTGLFQLECCDNLQKLTLDKSIQVPNQMSCKYLDDKSKIGCETVIQNHTLFHALPDTKCHNPVACMSTSVQAQGSDTENSVPDYVDIEALILEQDLIPWDQESDFFQSEVSRFCSREGGKDLMKLEKGAYSSMNRSIMSKGAFAIVYGQHLIYYIRDNEVTLGRETGDVRVDIDLGKEGNANKISRRQAVIKMDSGGSFYMKNIGKGSIFVNGKEVPCSKSILLTSDSLIEIRNLRLMFHVNDTAVRRHIIRAMRESSQGNNTTFDWNQNA